MKIGIICAMEEELASILSALNIKCATKTDKGFIIHVANYNNYQLIFTLSGIGKVNAALHTQYLIDKYQPEKIINIGVAGSLSLDLTFGDVVIAADLVQYDMDVTAFGLPLGQIPRMEIFAVPVDQNMLAIAAGLKEEDYTIAIGRIISGDKFVAQRDFVYQLQKEFKALACEMEAAAIAQVCYVNKLAFLIVRALSDMAGQENDAATHSYNELKDMAALRSAVVVKKLLDLNI